MLMHTKITELAHLCNILLRVTQEQQICHLSWAFDDLFARLNCKLSEKCLIVTTLLSFII